MVHSELKNVFLSLVRLGIGHTEESGSIFQVSSFQDWVALKALADQHGLSAVVLDGLNEVRKYNDNANVNIPQTMLLQWIGEVMQSYEGRYAAYEKAIGSLAGFYNQHGYKMMVMKGYASSLDWPNPKHRP